MIATKIKFNKSALRAFLSGALRAFRKPTTAKPKKNIGVITLFNRSLLKIKFPQNVRINIQNIMAKRIATP